MKKREYRDKVLSLLEVEFGFPILFNGQEAISKGLSTNALGSSYINKKQKPCVIRWQREFVDTLQTTFHEIGHSALHGKGSGFQCGKSFKEVEAEMVAKRACELLEVDYRAGFKRQPHINYIDYYRYRYESSCRNFGNVIKQPRLDKIDEVAHRIYRVLKNVVLT